MEYHAPLIKKILCRYGSNKDAPQCPCLAGKGTPSSMRVVKKAGWSTCPIRGWAVTHVTLYLIIISFVLAHYSSSPAIL